jgi:GDP-4-dehydro-6-deoxy-D-mannose reductase
MSTSRASSVTSTRERIVRILVTGATGFVASHFRDALFRACGADTEVIATAREPGTHPIYGAVAALDVTSRASTEQAFTRYTPTHVVHLAGIAAPSIGNASPHVTWQVHLYGALNIAETILAWNPDCWLLHVGTALVYGESGKSGLALNEDTLLAPLDEYAASKAAADLALGAMTHRGLKCIRFRPFNHSGPGQAEGFVLPDFALQIAKIEAGLIPPVMRVGNLDVERDFLDVRDVVESYALAAREVASLAPGMIFNIASGIPRRVGDILEVLLRQSQASISLERDPARLRSTDLPRLFGDASRARNCLTWSPKRRFEDTITDVLNDWRGRLARSA